MPTKLIAISDLLVNAENDRHGSMRTERLAIEWHFTNLKDKALKLAKDIVEQGQIYEPLLVKPEGDKFVVRDGNRRTTCIKAILNPDLIPDQSLRDQFKKLRSNIDIKKLEQLECRIESEEQVINAIIHRRHTGGSSGVGQLKWGAIEKENYLKRIGQLPSNPIGYAISSFAEQNKLVRPGEKIPVSTLQRLMSSADVRNRIGVDFSHGNIVPTRDKSKVIKIVSQIIRDFSSGAVTLKDVWNNQDKHDYLDKLTREGYAITPSTSPAGKPTKTAKNAGNKGGKLAGKLTKRQTLIPKDLDPVFAVRGSGQNKIMRLWDELQTKIYVNHAPCAVGVTFRCLLELATGYYVSRTHLHVRPDLHLRIKDVATHMLEKGLIQQSDYTVIDKLSNSEQTISVRTFHDYVHNNSMIPSGEHLKILWENFETYILACLK